MSLGRSCGVSGRPGGTPGLPLERRAVEAYVLETGRAVWDVLREMAPYLLFGFLVAGGLAVWVPREAVERHLAGPGLLAVAKAAVFGIPLPLCSCGVIPVAASLRRHGAGRGPATAFLLSTPQTGVDSVLVTFSLLGPVFAVFRPLASLASGLLGGMIVSRFGGAGGEEPPPPACTAACCAHGEPGSRWTRAFRYGFRTLPDDIGPALLLGIVLAGLLTAFVPEDFFAGLLGGGMIAMGVMLLAGIPMYVCATASVPLAAALIAKGVSPGAALVFLLTGPATNAASVTTLWKVMGRRTTILYLGIVAVTALGSGLALDAIITRTPAVLQGGAGHVLPAPVHTASAFVLAALLLVSAARAAQRRFASAGGRAPSRRVRIRIGGMRCGVCAAAVSRALWTFPGVEGVAVDLDGGEAEVRGRDLDVGGLKRTVEDAGFSAGGGALAGSESGHARHGPRTSGPPGQENGME